jgi:hypothetical protein
MQIVAMPQLHNNMSNHHEKHKGYMKLVSINWNDVHIVYGIGDPIVKMVDKSGPVFFMDFG